MAVVPIFSREQLTAPLDHGLAEKAEVCLKNKDIPGAARNFLAFFRPRSVVFRETGWVAPFWDMVLDSFHRVGEAETSSMFWNADWNDGGLEGRPEGCELAMSMVIDEEGFEKPFSSGGVIEYRKTWHKYACAYMLSAHLNEEVKADRLGLWWGWCDGENCRTSEAEWEVYKPILEHKRKLARKYNADIVLKYPWSQDPREFFWYEYRDLAVARGVEDADAVICNGDWTDDGPDEKVNGKELRTLVDGLKEGMKASGYNFYWDETLRLPKDANDEERGNWHG